MGVTLRGDACQVLRDERRLGHVFRWTFVGQEGDWLARGEKYRLAEGETEALAGDLEFRFLLGRSVDLEVCAQGVIESVVVADGLTHRDTVLLKGEKTWIRQPSHDARFAGSGSV